MSDYPEGLVSRTLESLGVDAARIAGDEIWALCPQHRSRTGNPDHNPSWSINSRSGLHKCFSCGYRGNLFVLVKDLGGDVSALPGSSRDRSPTVADWTKGLVTERDFPSARAVGSPGRSATVPSIALFTPPPDSALMSRRLSRKAAERYRVRWNSTDSRWILPLYSPDNGKLLGYQEKGPRYFRNHPLGMRKNSTMFGLPQVTGSDRVVVVESPLDSVRLAGMGYDSVALCGSMPSDAQMSLLSGFTHVVWALDNDEAGARGTDRVLRDPWFKCSVVQYEEGDGKDVGEMDDARIVAILTEAGL